jgi:hypothetical protein
VEEVKRGLINEIKLNIANELARKGLSLPIFVVNAWAFTDATSPAFEEAALMNELHRLAYRRISARR